MLFLRRILAVALILPLLPQAFAAPAPAGFCEAVPKLAKLPEQRCVNFDQFSDAEVKSAKEGCRKYYESVKSLMKNLCEFAQEGEKLDRELDALRATAGNDEDAKERAHFQAVTRTNGFYRRWGFKLAGDPRRQLELAYRRYKDVISKLNDYGLDILRDEAQACGRPNVVASPAYLGLALTAGYEGAHTHKVMSELFNAMVDAMAERAPLEGDVAERIKDVPERSERTELPKGDDPAHVAEPGVKLLISEAISQVLKLEGLSSLGVDLADKFLISQKIDKLDMIVLGTKALIIVAGGASAGPTVGISLGISLAITSAIDYLEYSIRGVAGSFEKLTRSRMEEVLTYHSCKARRKELLNSSELAKSYHFQRRDGICGADCAERGSMGSCRPSTLFTADRCE